MIFLFKFFLFNYLIKKIFVMAFFPLDFELFFPSGKDRRIPRIHRLLQADGRSVDGTTSSPGPEPSDGSRGQPEKQHDSCGRDLRPEMRVVHFPGIDRRPADGKGPAGGGPGAAEYSVQISHGT